MALRAFLFVLFYLCSSFEGPYLGGAAKAPRGTRQDVLHRGPTASFLILEHVHETSCIGWSATDEAGDEFISNQRLASISISFRQQTPRCSRVCVLLSSEGRRVANPVQTTAGGVCVIV